MALGILSCTEQVLGTDAKWLSVSFGLNDNVSMVWAARQQAGGKLNRQVLVDFAKEVAASTSGGALKRLVAAKTQLKAFPKEII